MRTPSGVECQFFYGNYFRGRNTEECRLIGNAPPPNHWKSDLCKTCPVPGIMRANACPTLVLEARVSSGLLGRFRRVNVSAYCTRSKQKVDKPEIGCGLCHPLPSFIKDEKK